MIDPMPSPPSLWRLPFSPIWERGLGVRASLACGSTALLFAIGSLSEAEDAVQEAWLHMSRSNTSGVANLGGYLATVVARICLDRLRSRKSRREEPGSYVQVPRWRFAVRGR
jgi:hypothetical protein